MRAYEKQTLICKQRTRFVLFDGKDAGAGNGKDIAIAGDTINCEYFDGPIRPVDGATAFTLDGLGITVRKEAPAPDSFFLFPVKKSQGVFEYNLGYLTVAGVVYVYNATTRGFDRKHTFSSRMRGLQVFDGEENARLFFVGRSGLFVYDGSQMRDVTPARAVGEVIGDTACVCKDRLFVVIKPFTLAYSAPLEPENFEVSENDGGRICFPSDKGEIVGVAATGEFVYIFYEYGISRLRVKGSAREFDLEKLEYGGGKIFGDSVGVVGVGGGKCFFLAEDGLYALSGDRVERIGKSVDVKPISGGQVCVHAESSGKYYLYYQDERKGKTGVFVDAETGNAYAAYAATGLSECGGKALTVRDTVLSYLTPDGAFPSGEKCVFSLQTTAFGVGGRKTLRRIRLYGDGEVKVRVGNGKSVKTVSAKFVSGEASVDVRMSGDAFSVAFIFNEWSYLRSAVAEIVTLSSVSTKRALGRVRE